jgi:hypothetical protein
MQFGAIRWVTGKRIDLTFYGDLTIDDPRVMKLYQYLRSHWSVLYLQVVKRMVPMANELKTYDGAPVTVDELSGQLDVQALTFWETGCELLFERNSAYFRDQQVYARLNWHGEITSTGLFRSQYQE